MVRFEATLRMQMSPNLHTLQFQPSCAQACWDSQPLFFPAISEIQVEPGFLDRAQQSAQKEKKKKVMREGGSTRVFMKPTRSVDKQTAAISKGSSFF